MRKEKLADGIELYCGDCVEIIPTIGTVAATICDPPYEDRMHEAKKSPKRKLRIDGDVELRALTFTSISALRPVMTPLLVEATDGWLIAFCTPEGIAPWRDAIEAAGARYKRACFWYKPDSTPQLNGQGPAFAVEPFVTAWCGPGFSKWNGGGRRNLFTHNTNSRDRHGKHETEKPVSLMSELITLFTNRGDTVLDPVMGSGSTGVAAVKNGRKFIGIETNSDFFEIACRRIEQTLKQPDLFIDASPRKKMKQSSFGSDWNKARGKNEKGKGQ